MSQADKETVKSNVAQFDRDISRLGGYAYTGSRISSSIANANISQAVHQIYQFKNMRVLDIGCGDGSYTLEFLDQGATQIVGVDPSVKAIELANTKIKELNKGVRQRVAFAVANIYELEKMEWEINNFDCIVLRGVLHHLPDAKQALMKLSRFEGVIIMMEPNGWNPILKVLEKLSAYHRAHEEQSFLPSTICGWLAEAGFINQSVRFINCVPMFCPDWMARLALAATPFIERLPLVRVFGCGQQLIVARK